MRIAIASDDSVQVAAHTGRCRGFAIYETDGTHATPMEYRDNNYTAHAKGLCPGEHDHAVQEHHSHVPLIDAIADCCALISRGMGPRLVADLAAEGIMAYVCSVDSVDEASHQFAEGRLQRVSGTGCCSH